jgi:hypothetical protein
MGEQVAKDAVLPPSAQATAARTAYSRQPFLLGGPTSVRASYPDDAVRYVLGLQRTAGNAAVATLLAPAPATTKLHVGVGSRHAGAWQMAFERRDGDAAQHACGDGDQTEVATVQRGGPSPSTEPQGTSPRASAPPRPKQGTKNAKPPSANVAEHVATRAVLRRADVVYVPRRLAPVVTVLRVLPVRIVRRLLRDAP